MKVPFFFLDTKQLTPVLNPSDVFAFVSRQNPQSTFDACSDLPDGPLARRFPSGATRAQKKKKKACVMIFGRPYIQYGFGFFSTPFCCAVTSITVYDAR